MFQFDRLPLVFPQVPFHNEGWVAPLGNLRLRLPAATRSLSQLGYVLLRLLMPRHPPTALNCLACSLSSSLDFLKVLDFQPVCLLTHNRRTSAKKVKVHEDTAVTLECSTSSQGHSPCGYRRLLKSFDATLTRTSKTIIVLCCTPAYLAARE
jgi:hypothetical protein